MVLKKVKVSTTPLDALTPFALQILLDSALSLDGCRVVVATIGGVKTNLYSFGTDEIVEDLMTRLRDLIESFKERRGKMRVAYVALTSMKGAEQLETIVLALANAFNSPEFRRATLEKRRDMKAARDDANRKVLDKTGYSAFRPLRNKGTNKEYRPRDRTEFDQPRQARDKKMFAPLELPREQQLLLKPEQRSVTRPTLDSYKETDIIIPSDLSAWQLRLLLEALA